MPKIYDHFMGIDVSKTTLDCSIAQRSSIKDAFRIANNKHAVRQLLDKLKALGMSPKKTLFCFENTGLYNHNLAYELSKHSLHTWIENALVIKKSSGFTRGKSDKIDAQRIALYASRFQDRARLWLPKREVILKLESLFRARKMLVKNATQIVKQIKITQETDGLVVGLGNEFLYPVITVLKEQLKKIEKKIRVIYASDEKIKRQMTIATSIPGVGEQIALAVLIDTNEFQEKNSSKKLACHAGIAPFDHLSGTSVRGHSGVSHYANKELKKVLHMGAVSAITRAGELQEYYQRKVAEGKPKMLVLNNVRNKMITRLCACIKNDREYEKNYTQKFG